MSMVNGISKYLIQPKNYNYFYELIKAMACKLGSDFLLHHAKFTSTICWFQMISNTHV